MARLVGVLGGTFDPPHNGHLYLACEGHRALGLDAVAWVVTADPPHKINAPINPVAVRLAMVLACLDSCPSFEISYADIDRPGPHYSLDTMIWLRRGSPADRFVFLMGSDSLADLPNWHRPRTFLGLCESLGVLKRPGEDVDLEALEKLIPGISAKVRFIDRPPLEISGREIRRRVRAGEPYEDMVPERVAEIIKQDALYR